MADVLRYEIRRAGLSAMALARETGVAQPTITQFLRGRNDLRLKTAQKLADHFGLVLVRRKR